MAATSEEQAAYDERVAGDIQKFGCHVLSVFDPDKTLLDFTYSIGIQKTTAAPEIIVLGLTPKLGHSLISHYHRLVREGKRFEAGGEYPGFLDGFTVFFEPAPNEQVRDLMLGCERYYGAGGYQAVQLVYPTTKGLWPWEPGVSEKFIKDQPMLGRKQLK